MKTRKISINSITYRLTATACLLTAVLFGVMLDAAVTVRADCAINAAGSDFARLQADTRNHTDVGSMAGAESAEGGPTVYITTPALVGGGGPEYRRPDMKAVCYTALYESDYRRFADLTTTASISSKKAHEFTLVGAKPSGTG